MLSSSTPSDRQLSGRTLEPSYKKLFLENPVHVEAKVTLDELPDFPLIARKLGIDKAACRWICVSTHFLSVRSLI